MAPYLLVTQKSCFCYLLRFWLDSAVLKTISLEVDATQRLVDVDNEDRMPDVWLLLVPVGNRQLASWWLRFEAESPLHNNKNVSKWWNL